jgi:archaellum component FlaC
MDNNKNVSVIIAEISKDISFIRDTVERLEESIDDIKKAYVTKEEFSPVKSVAYGMVSIVLVTVMGALLSLIVLK